MKNILRSTRGIDYLTGNPCLTEEHHIFYNGRGQRKLSEKYGLKVYLSTYSHRSGPAAVHKSKEVRKRLERIAQLEFEHRFNIDESYRAKAQEDCYGQKYTARESFMHIFGKNCIGDEENET